MDVVSVNEGKNLGKVYDIAFYLPENKIKGFFVTGSKGFHFSKSDMFVPVKHILRIGEDVILVDDGSRPPQGEKPPFPYPPKPDCPPKPPCPPDPRRSFDDYE